MSGAAPCGFVWYTKDPDQSFEGRYRIRTHQCDHRDGHAGDHWCGEDGETITMLKAKVYAKGSLAMDEIDESKPPES
jgi:hypothetical protein